MNTTRKRLKPKRVGMVLTLWFVCAGIQGSVAQTAASSEAKTASAVHMDGPKLNEKQKALAEEADRLLAMATELKDQVDRTNKNILSVKVVEKAEEIEHYARHLKDQAKK